MPSTCTLSSLKSFIDQGESREASSIADVLQVHCPPVFAETRMELESQELSARCSGGLSWAAAMAPRERGEGPRFEVELDDDGNATAVLWGGPSCAAGESLIVARMVTAPFETFATAFTIIAPKPSHAGVKALPAKEVEDATTSSVATIIQVELPPVYAEQEVDVSANQLAARCLAFPHLMWIGPDEQVLSGLGEPPFTTVPVHLDNDGNAFVVLFGDSSCAAGTSQIEASLVGPPDTTYTTNFTIKPPAVVNTK